MDTRATHERRAGGSGTRAGTRRLIRIVLVMVLLSAPLALLGRPAYAEDSVSSKWRVTDYQLTARPQTNGSTEVTLDLAFDFSTDKGHGPFITLPLRQRVADNPDVWRELPTRIVEVTSPTGAAADVDLTEEDNSLVVKVGKSSKQYTGVQKYRISYVIDGLINPRVPGTNTDELNWNAVGPGWQVPIDHAAITVEAPRAATQVWCWSGRDFDVPCSAAKQGRRTTFGADGLAKESGMQVVTAYPAGTFPEAAAPTYSKRYHPGNVAPVTPATGGSALALLVAGVAGVFLVLRSRRDQAYAELTPGQLPRAGQQPSAATTRAAGAPVAVQFTPPRVGTPGELGTLIDSEADQADVTATLVDLAVRGLLRIEKTGPGPKELVLHRTFSQAPVAVWERQLLDELFHVGPSISGEELASKPWGEVFNNAKRELDRRVVSEHHWYARRPTATRARAVFAGLGLLLVAAGLGFALAGIGWSLLALPVALTGVLVMAVNKRFCRRTPQGSAMYAQTLGFRLYLTTAEADQIRFEEGVDVFSRYLPYAIAFGAAQHWTRVFDELSRQGRYTPDTGWYVGAWPGASGMGFAGTFDGLTSSMSASVSAGVSATSSGSGAGGGGGVGGGGGGGW